MTETEKAIDDLVQHFLLHQEKDREQITQAIERLAYSKDGEVFHQLGLATLTAMVHADLAAFEARKTVVIANMPTRGPMQ